MIYLYDKFGRICRREFDSLEEAEAVAEMFWDSERGSVYPVICL